MRTYTIVLLALVGIVYIGHADAYRITIQNTLDGPLAVNITEGNVTTPRTVAPQEYFNYDTAGCYILTFTVISGRAIGQVGGAGNAFDKVCRDYKAITRFLISPYWDPITGKEDLVPRIMEVREE